MLVIFSLIYDAIFLDNMYALALPIPEITTSTRKDNIPILPEKDKFSSTSFPYCIVNHKPYQLSLNEFVKDFAEKRNRELSLIITNNIDYSNFSDSIIKAIKQVNFPSEESFKYYLRLLTLINLQNKSLRVKGDLMCSIEMKGNGPFCSGPIFSTVRISELLANGSIYIPIKGEVYISGRKIPFSYSLNIYRFETRSTASAFGYDGINKSGSFVKGANLILASDLLQRIIAKQGTVVIKIDGNQEVLLKLNDQDVKFGLVYRCRF